MQFSNAAKGVKKLFSSMILEIIGGIGMTISAIFVFGVVTLMENGGENELAVAGTVGLAALGFSGILTVISAVLSIVGLIQSSKDEGSFKTAIFVLIAGVVIGVLANIFTDLTVLTNILSQIADLLRMIMIILVIQGVINLAESLGDTGIIKHGKKLFILITVIYGLSCLANIIVAVFGGNTASVIASVISVAAELLGVVQMVVYMAFLAKAMKMLKNN